MHEKNVYVESLGHNSMNYKKGCCVTVALWRSLTIPKFFFNF